MKVLIIENEPNNRVLLQKMLEKIAEIREIKSAQSANEAIAVMKTFRPNLVLLDIEMPGGSGFDFLDALPSYSFKVIFVTAHENYAIKAIRAKALDYLLKPVSFESLNKAVLKFSEQGERVEKELKLTCKISISTLQETFFVSLRDLVRISSAGSYCIYHLKDGREIVASYILKIACNELPTSVFFRAHNSHVINLYYVEKMIKVDGLEIEMKDGSSVPISRRKKDEFVHAMKVLPERIFY